MASSASDYEPTFALENLQSYHKEVLEQYARVVDDFRIADWAEITEYPELVWEKSV